MTSYRMSCLVPKMMITSEGSKTIHNASTNTCYNDIGDGSLCFGSYSPSEDSDMEQNVTSGT